MTDRSGSRRARILLGVFVAVLLTLLPACGSSSSGGGGAAGKVDGSTIVLQTVSGLEPQFQSYAKAYMKEYPSRKVEVRATTDDGAKYAQQLATARLGGELPDVFFNVDYLANTLARNNVTLDLAPGIKDGKLGKLGIGDFLPQFVGQYRPIDKPDQVTGLPVSADSVGLFYNKTIFKKLGITETPKSDWTWDDMYRVAAEVKAKSDGKYIGLSAPINDGSGQIVFGPVLKAFGAKVYDPATGKSDIGSPQADKAWSVLLKAYGNISGPYSAKTDDPSMGFSSGNVAMSIGSRATIPQAQSTLKDAWDVQSMPTINGKSTAGGGSYGLSIAQTSKNQDAAWAFLAWFYDAAKGMKVAQKVGGVIPPTEDGIANGSWKDTGGKPPEHIAVFGTSAKTAVLLAQLPGSSGTVLTQATTKATQQVVLKHVSVQQAFNQAQQTLNDQLAKDTKKK